MAAIDRKVKLRVSTHFEFKIQPGVFRVQTLKFDFKPKTLFGKKVLKLKGIDKFSSQMWSLRLISLCVPNS